MTETQNSHDEKITVLNSEISPEQYGDVKQYYDHLLEQYKLYVASAESTSNKRGLSNTFFLTLHTLIITTLGIMYENGYTVHSKLIIIFILIALLALCWVWIRMNISYKQLNNAKFKVIGAFEENFPAKPFVFAEWKMLGEGKDINLYTPLGDIENLVPGIFAALYILGALVILYD
jgi:hypothetical protein